ncbi:heavy metal translocatin [Myriangium duriaei CBS 260.36]|uniref:Heavy metal translocatin n=1 Tax=Myriangium duriaei CBS 260.36 TaxID=1168546 RepID=A0A9P4MHE5_9PEZI|nr:heavy metal translocatin [Myriangium duriaei CBS 260.36]
MHSHNTIFLVSNLHCPSCVGNIEAALAPNASMLSHSIVNHTVTIRHEAPSTEVAELLEGLGYEVDSAIPEASEGQGRYVQPIRNGPKHLDPRARLDKADKHRQNCKQCQEEDEKLKENSAKDAEKPDFVVTDSSGSHGLYEISLSVEGMTCSSCVGAISKALEKTPWVASADVNLLSASATVRVHGDNHSDELVEVIEDLGYDASIQETRLLDSKKDSQVDHSSNTSNAGDAVSEAPMRTVDLLVNGMYCHHCPSKIVSKVTGVDKQNMKIIQQPTLQNPVLRLTYRPDGPVFTVRTIISAISEADSAFAPTITHPPTLDERARRMHAREQRRLLLRIILSGVIAIPTLIIGIVYMTLVSHQNSQRQYLMSTLHGVSRSEWALFVLATPVYFFCADIFHRRAVKEIRTLWHRRSKIPILRRFYRFGSMSMLLSFGTTIAYIASIAELAIAASQNMANSEGMNSYTYFDSVVFLTFFLLIGRYIESYSKKKSGDAVAALGRLRPTEAQLISADGTESKVGVDLLDIGDTVIVPRGASPPCDGIILSGNGIFDESSLTGESKPVAKKIGDEVFSGTINNGDALEVKITGAADSSMLDQIISAVRDGQTKRAPVERVVDSLTSYFVPVVTLVAILTWIIWLSLGQSGTLPSSWMDISVGGWPYWSLQFAIAVFVIACPCGIGLAAPTALMVGGGLAAKHGILVKGGGEAFQEASQLDCIVFDKTGTLTVGGEPKVTDCTYFTVDVSEDHVLSSVVALESGSSHPIAKALIAHGKDRKNTPGTVQDSEEIPGKGMKGSIAIGNSRLEVLIGKQALMTDFDVALTSEHTDLAEEWSRQAKSIVYVANRSDSSAPFVLTALFSISDPIRPEAASVIASLQSLGITTYLLTGDNALTAAAVGAQLSIDPSNIIADVLPSEKAAKVRSLQSSLTSTKSKPRATIAMVGDGINDSPALATADVGIAIGSGSDVAISAAHFVLIRSDLNALLTLIRLSRKVFQRVRFNFFWALIYNLIALPVAAGCLYPVTTRSGDHVRLDPVWAALAMAASSVSVVGSSLALRSGLPGLGFKG